jgi:Na+-transporting methylmalonyl-CoA/oxaloacetate decarboxylase gamma subunit
MQSLNSALGAYLITIIFAMLIAVVLALVSRAVKRLHLEGDPVEPTSTTEVATEAQGLAPVAIAIAVARHQSSGN